jgi:hypothetical protein
MAITSMGMKLPAACGVLLMETRRAVMRSQPSRWEGCILSLRVLSCPCEIALAPRDKGFVRIHSSCKPAQSIADYTTNEPLIVSEIKALSTSLGDDLLDRQPRWHRGIPLTPFSPGEGLGWGDRRRKGMVCRPHPEFRHWLTVKGPMIYAEAVELMPSPQEDHVRSRVPTTGIWSSLVVSTV